MIPYEFEEKMRRILKDEFEEFSDSLSKPKTPGIRLNPLKTDTYPFLPFLKEPVPWAKNGFYYDPAFRPGTHVFHDAGLYYLQEPSAMAPVTLLDPKPGDRVLDLCAAPGGKSTQIASEMMGKGLLIANEIVPARASVLSSNIERMGITNALVTNEHPRNLAKRFRGWFDRILVDAPCSGEGMFRRENDAESDWNPDLVQLCSERQREILMTAADMLKPGGRLVYSTCTFSPEEDELTVEYFLSQRKDYQLISLSTENSDIENVCRIQYFSPGLENYLGREIPGLNRSYRLWPHKLNGDGHFAAVFQRLSGEEEKQKTAKLSEIPKICLEFGKEHSLDLPNDTALLFGDKVCVVPSDFPDISGLKVLRAGLEAGYILKNRFEPCHSWALISKTASSFVDLSPDSAELSAYLRGDTIPFSNLGWTLVKTGGLSLGWAKGSNGILKNHYPKGLRRVVLST